MSNLANIQTCGLTEVILFLLAILFGTGCSICSKTMMNLHGTNGTFTDDGEPVIEAFQKPLFQTFGMFVGMLFGLVMHWVVVFFRIPFPGYDHDDEDGNATSGDVEIPTEKTSLVMSNKSNNKNEESALPMEGGDSSSKEIPTWMYFFLAIPAIFDLAATALW